jgi:hypothetical protein
MPIERKSLIGIIIGIFFVAGVSGGFIGYYFPRIGEVGAFNVVIDGNFNAAEGWQYSDWQFIEYLLTDDDNLVTHNFFYVHLTTDSLYILVDFASDITDNTTDEFLAVWIDTDNSLSEFTGDIHWNAFATNPGHEMLCYIPEAEHINETLNLAGREFTATLNYTNSAVEYGFQTSINSLNSHRIFEIEIDRTALKGFNSTNFNVGFLGYGTVFIPIYIDYGFWGAPTLFASEFYDHSEWVRERTYFRCGYGVEM